MSYVSCKKTFNIVRIPLHHLPPPFQIQRMVVRSSNRILIDMCKLSLNPCRIEPFLMQNRTHRVPKTMTSNLPRISNLFEYLINTLFTHRFAWVIAPWEHQRILPRHHFELLYNFQRLDCSGLMNLAT